jgi:hypothetical protein
MARVTFWLRAQQLLLIQLRMVRIVVDGKEFIGLPGALEDNWKKFYWLKMNVSRKWRVS